MSAQANIVAYDGAATPVSHTLLPMGAARLADGTMSAEWAERLATVPLGAQVSAATRKRSLKSGVEQCGLTVKIPKLEVISGQLGGYVAPAKVAYENTIVVMGYFDQRATPDERQQAYQLALNIAGGIATSVAAATTGPSIELFKQSISAS